MAAYLRICEQFIKFINVYVEKIGAVDACCNPLDMWKALEQADPIQQTISHYCTTILKVKTGKSVYHVLSALQRACSDSPYQKHSLYR